MPVDGGSESMPKATSFAGGIQIELQLEDGSRVTPDLHSIQDGEEEVWIDVSELSGRIRVRRAIISEPVASEEIQQPRDFMSSTRRQQERTADSTESQTNNLLSTTTRTSSVHEPDAPLPSIVPSTHDETKNSQEEVFQIPECAPPVHVERLKLLEHKDSASSLRQVNRRATINKRASMRVVTQMSSMDDAGGQTPLHQICASSSLNFRRFQELIESHPDMVSQADNLGQLPLHCLGNNSDLLNFPEGQALAHKCALLLMDLHPSGITRPDSEGRMPFTYLILKWVEWTFSQDEFASKAAQSTHHNVTEHLHKMRTRISTACSVSIVNNTSNSIIKPPQRDSRGSTSHTAIDFMNRSSNRFPPVMIFDEVEWCFDMLSIAMDHLGGNPLDPSKKVRPRLAYRKQRDGREALADNIAHIPMLLKTVLLLESRLTRKHVMESSAIRRVLLCHASIGPWLTSMIRYNKGTSSEVAVNLLTTLSTLSVDDYIGEYRKALPHDERLFQKAKLEVFEKVEGLSDTIPSLLVAGVERLDQAIATPVICFVMNRGITRPFSVSAGVTDFKLHLVAMIAFRHSALENTENVTFILFPFMTLASVIFFVCLHHIVRTICEAVVLTRISKKVAMSYIFDFWNVVDLVGIILAMWATAYSERMHDDVRWPFLFAIILGLLWLRVLGFLKVVNEQLATFILSMSQILVDVRFFFIVFCVFILMHGDMFRLIFQNDDDIDCAGADLDEVPYGDFCGNSVSSYLRVYAVIVGDFELSEYRQKSTVVFLWFFVTFFGAVVMLNVLIAVITFSYSKSQDSSIILFRRARAQFIASHSAMEQFLLPRRYNGRAENTSSRCSQNGMALHLLRWFFIISTVMTTTWSSLYLIELLAAEVKEAAIIGMIITGFMCLLLVYSVWTTVFFVMAVFVGDCIPESRVKVSAMIFVDKANEYLVTKISSQIFGIDTTDTEGGEIVRVGETEHEALISRLDKLEKTLQQVLARKEPEDNLDGDDQSAIHSSEFFR